MFRRIFALLAAMLLLLPVLPIRAEGSFASVFLVVDPLAEDPIGLAALCEGQVYTVSAVAQSRAASPMLLGSRTGMQAVEDYALAPCGLARISAGLEKSAGFAMGELAPGYAQALIRSYWNMATVTVTVTSTVPWQGNSCYLVQSTQALPYGTPVLNADGNLGDLWPPNGARAQAAMWLCRSKPCGIPPGLLLRPQPKNPRQMTDPARSSTALFRWKA